MADSWIEYELTNDQRRCFALEQVEPGHVDRHRQLFLAGAVQQCMHSLF